MYYIISFVLLITLPGVVHAQANVIYDNDDGERIVFNTAEFFYIVTYSSEVDDETFELRSGEIWPGNNISPSVSASVTLDAITNEFIYAYSLTNRPEGPYGISNISFLTQAVLEGDDFSVFNGWLPIHKPSTGKVLWTYIKEPLYEGLQPGNTQEGYALTHAGLPTLIEYRTQAQVSWLFPDQGLRGEVADLSYQILEDTEYISGQTVGPRALPDPFVELDFLDDIIFFNQQAEVEGWIGSAALGSSIDSQLQAAKTSLQSNDYGIVASTLTNLLVEVEDEYANGSDLSSEGYALLKYNIEYLLNE